MVVLQRSTATKVSAAPTARPQTPLRPAEAALVDDGTIWEDVPVDFKVDCAVIEEKEGVGVLLPEVVAMLVGGLVLEMLGGLAAELSLATLDVAGFRVCWRIIIRI